MDQSICIKFFYKNKINCNEVLEVLKNVLVSLLRVRFIYGISNFMKAVKTKKINAQDTNNWWKYGQGEKNYYGRLMNHNQRSNPKKCPDIRRNNSLVLHHDNKSAHSSLLIHEFLPKNITAMMSQPQHLPDGQMRRFPVPKK